MWKSREEQLTWAKQRALICVDVGGFSDAVAGLRADLDANPLTKGVVSSDQARRGYKAAMDAALGRSMASPTALQATEAGGTQVATPAQCESLRRAIAISVAILVSGATPGAGLISSAPHRGERKPSKLSRAIRALLQAKVRVG
jgi:hypothetical protein